MVKSSKMQSEKRIQLKQTCKLRPLRIMVVVSLFSIKIQTRDLTSRPVSLFATVSK